MAANRYAVTTRRLGVKHAQSISLQAFLAARAAVDLLITCIELEEAYDVAIASYLAFETAMMRTAVEGMVDRRLDRVELDEDRRELERHLIGLLASAEMYVSHAELRALPLERRGHLPASTLENALAREKVAHLGFRAGEHLRNAVLHRKRPISSWTLAGVWLDLDDDHARRLQHTVTISFDPEILNEKKERAPDPSLIADLKAIADPQGRVSWVPIVRGYVEGLSGLHMALREALGVSEAAAVDLLDKMVSDYRADFPADRQPVTVIAVEEDAAGQRLREVSLDFDYRRRVDWLRRRNRRLVNLGRRSIAG